MQKSFFSIIIVAICLFLNNLILFAQTVAYKQQKTFQPVDTIAGATQRVHTGIYLMNLYDLKLDDHSFYADFYIWFKWKGDIDPTQVEFVNVIEKWAITQNAFQDTVKVLSDGYKYTGMRVEGRFYHPFALERFPLDSHNLAIQIEHAQYPYDSIIYVPDSLPYVLHNRFQMPGWNLLGTEAVAVRHTYNSNFGDIDEGEGNYGSCTFTLTIERPFNYFLFKLLLPLLLVIVVSIGAMFIFPTYVDARISLPIGGMLTAVFLQQSYNEALPEVGYMVLMDKIYVLGYLLISLAILKVIMSGNKVKLKEDMMNVHRLGRRDAFIAFVLFFIFIVGMLLLIFID